MAVHHDQNFFDKPAGNRRNMVYGALETDLTATTSLLMGASYQKDVRRGASYGVPFYVDGSDIGLPRRQGLEAPWSNVEFERHTVFAQLQHALAHGWKAKLNVRHTGINTSYRHGSVQLPPDPLTNGGAYWVYYDGEPRHDRSFTVDANVLARSTRSPRSTTCCWVPT